MPSSYTPSSLGNPTIAGGALNLATWTASTAYALNTVIQPTSRNGLQYKATAIAGTGTSSTTQPTWPTVIGLTVVDNAGSNQITWTCNGTAPQAAVAPPVTIPVSTDNRTAASIDISVDSIADYLALLLQQSHLPGQSLASYTGYTLNTISSSTSIPVTLVNSFITATGSSANLRCYVSQYGFIFTVNAYIDPTHNSWTADNTAAPASAVHIGSDVYTSPGASTEFVASPSSLAAGGVAGHWFENRYLTGTNAGWNVLADFSQGTGALIADVVGAGSNYLQIYNGIATMAGLTLFNAVTGADTSPLIGTTIPVGAVRRLVSQHGNRSGIISRIYADNAITADADGWGMSFTTNASWNGTNWVKDTSSSDCSRFCLSGQGLFYEYVPGSQASPFSDNVWAPAFAATGAGAMVVGSGEFNGTGSLPANGNACPIVILTTGGNLTLPSSPVLGQLVTIKNVTNTPNYVQVKSTALAIDGTAANTYVTIAPAYGVLRLVCAGSPAQWWSI